MRTVTFKSMFEAVLRLRGLDPETAELAPADAERLAAALTAAVRRCWEFAFWPELLLLEERMYRATWSAVTTYAADAEVYHVDAAGDGRYYVSLQAANLNKDPDTETAWWSEQTALDPYVAYEQTGQTRIPEGGVYRLCEENPRKDASPYYVDYFYSDNGVQIAVPDEAPAEVWIEFRRQPSEFTAYEWNATRSYATGERCYVKLNGATTVGECYRALAAGTNKNPTTETTYWERESFPWLFRDCAARFAYAEELRREGNKEKADDEEDRAQERLEQVADSALGQRSQTAIGENGY